MPWAAKFLGAETWEQALECLQQDPDVVIVCYVFDAMRPFALFQYVRHDLQRSDVPLLLVRALPIRLGGTQEAQIREAYKALGMDEFFNLHDEGERYGTQEALARFRDLVFARIPTLPDAYPTSGSSA